MTPPRRYSPVEWCGLAVAAVVTALGATMVIAWELELVELLRLVDSGPALRFNTAILFVLCGLTLACNILGQRRAAASLASVALLFALLCTARALHLINVDVENILYRPSESLEERVGAGRVALGTSISILLFSMAMLAQNGLRHGDVVALLLGIVICMISWVALNRYVMGGDTMIGWRVTTGMAFVAAAALFCLGAITIALSCGPYRSTESTHWLSYSVAMGFAIVSFMIWRELVDNETRHLRRTTAAAATAIKLQIKERLQTRQQAVDRFATRWDARYGEEKRVDAKRLLEDFNGILSLYWVTDDFRIGWICRSDDRQPFLGVILPPGPRRDALNQATDARRFTFTPVIQLISDEPGFVGYTPTFGREGQINGCAAAIFRVQEFLDAIAVDRRQIGYEFNVADAGQVIFESAETLPEDPSSAVTTTFQFRGLNWEVRVWPTFGTVAGYRSYAPQFAFAEGLLSALLIGAAIQLRQRAQRRTIEAEQTAKSLHSSEQRFDLAVSASQDGIWEWQHGTDSFYASPRYREILGYPLDDKPISYHAWFARISPDDVDRIQQAIQGHFYRGLPYDIVVRFRTFREEWIWLRIRGQGAWNESGKAVRMAGSITDITEEREAQRQLLQHVETIAASNKALAELAEAAEAAAEAKATFLRNMSHELRTPLNSIIGFSTGLLRHIASHNLDDHQRDRIERIAASGRHLLELVNNVLDIAKAEASEQSHQPESFELPMLIDEVTAMTEPLLQKKTAVKLAVQIASDAPTPVLDRAKLKQVLLNLLSNAAKFTDRGSIDLSVDFTPDGWRFAVADTGIGISADDRLRVFENFEQVHSPGRSVEGTGLGLSICATLAQAMGGQIALVSRPGAGSTFTLLIPQGVEIPNTEENTTPQPNDEPAKVFAVDESVSPPIWLVPAKTNLPTSSAPPEFPAASV